MPSSSTRYTDLNAQNPWELANVSKTHFLSKWNRINRRGVSDLLSGNAGTCRSTTSTSKSDCACSSSCGWTMCSGFASRSSRCRRTSSCRMEHAGGVSEGARAGALAVGGASTCRALRCRALHCRALMLAIKQQPSSSVVTLRERDDRGGCPHKAGWSIKQSAHQLARGRKASARNPVTGGGLQWWLGCEFEDTCCHAEPRGTRRTQTTNDACENSTTLPKRSSTRP